jgi:hypothetical protein
MEQLFIASVVFDSFFFNNEQDEEMNEFCNVSIFEFLRIFSMSTNYQHIIIIPLNMVFTECQEFSFPQNQPPI